MCSACARIARTSSVFKGLSFVYTHSLVEHPFMFLPRVKALLRSLSEHGLCCIFGFTALIQHVTQACAKFLNLLILPFHFLLIRFCVEGGVDGLQLFESVSQIRRFCFHVFQVLLIGGKKVFSDEGQLHKLWKSQPLIRVHHQQILDCHDALI